MAWWEEAVGRCNMEVACVVMSQLRTARCCWQPTLKRCMLCMHPPQCGCMRRVVYQLAWTNAREEQRITTRAIEGGCNDECNQPQAYIDVRNKERVFKDRLLSSAECMYLVYSAMSVTRRAQTQSERIMMSAIKSECSKTDLCNEQRACNYLCNQPWA